MDSCLARVDEAVRLLRRVLHHTQALEEEVRELKRRMLWAVPANDGVLAQGHGAIPSLPLSRGARSNLRPCSDPSIEVEKPRGGGRHAVHTPKGRAATARMKAARTKLGLTQERMATALGVTTAMVGFIESGRCGISYRLHPRLAAIEQRPKAGG